MKYLPCPLIGRRTCLFVGCGMSNVEEVETGDEYA
jgi:hypothetical protein